MTGAIGQYQGPAYGALKVPPNNPNVSPSMEANYSVKEAKQDAIKTAQNSWIGNIAQGLGIKDGDPKKLIGCVLGTVAMVFGISAIGKNTKIFRNLGTLGDNISNAVGGWIKSKDSLCRFGENVSGHFKNFKKWFTEKNPLTKKLSDNVKAIFTKNADGLRENVITPVNSLVKPMTKGTKWEVVDNVTDALQTMFKTEADDSGLFARILPKGLRARFKNLMEGTVEDKLQNQQKLKKFVLDKGKTEADYNKMVDAIKELSSNQDIDYKFKVYKTIKETLGSTEGLDELLTQKAHGFRVGLFDAIERAEIVNGTQAGSVNGKVAKTKLGRALQKGLFRAMEAPSNGVASRTVMGYTIALPIYFGVFNKVFAAKKGEKVSKFAEESVGDMGGYMMMPVTAGALYGATSLLKYFGLSESTIKNFKTSSKALNTAYKTAADKASKQAIKGQFDTLYKKTFKQGNWFEKLIRKPGQILSLGLESKPGSIFKGKVGGALRFGLFMFALSPLFMKPVMGICHKIFGTPSDTKEEMEKAKAEKAAKKAAKNAPPLEMTQEELMQKLSERPQLVARLQNDPKLMQELQQNPAKLIQLINETPVTAAQNPSSQIPQGTMSPALRDKISATNAQTTQTAPSNQVPNQSQTTEPSAPQAMQQNKPAQQQPQTAQGATEPTRSYIPSSAPVATNATTTTPEQQGKLQEALAKADAAEAQAMKYL